MDNAEEEVREMLRRWVDGLKESDTATLDQLMADDLIHTDPSGAVHNREQVLAGLLAGKDVPFESVETDDVKVRVYGDAAVATGYTAMKVRYNNQEIVGKFRFTDVFIKQQGRWQIVATHTTAITQP